MINHVYRIIDLRRPVSAAESLTVAKTRYVWFSLLIEAWMLLNLARPMIVVSVGLQQVHTAAHDPLDSRDAPCRAAIALDLDRRTLPRRCYGRWRLDLHSS
jgi:hypothetical protein